MYTKLYDRLEDRYDAEPFTYEDEELEPPPLDEREEAMADEGQLNHTDESAAANQNGVTESTARTNK